ncbi:hypothetical protein [Kitasatospora sp. NPDC059803]|uniref:hypothetical protein n=1 Tax=unclassified Kitasatospora TaxID=2633591 RepID=UPI00364D2894
MSGTRHLEGGATGRAARWLAGALLVPALAACSGGGGGGGGTATVPTGQGGGGSSGQNGGSSGQNGGSSGQNGGPGGTEDARTKGGGGGGGFADAGEVSASATGVGVYASVTLRSTSTKTFTAVLSQVTDCSEGAAPATPPSKEVTVTGGRSAPQQFVLATGSATGRPLCLTVTVDGESRYIRAEGLIKGSEGGGGTGTPNSGGTGLPTGGGGTGTPTGSTP